MRTMKGREAAGFVLWCYLSLNAEGFELALSNVAVSEATGMSKDSYDFAVRLLREKGYLKRRTEPGAGNTFDFYQEAREPDKDVKKS